MSSSTKFYALTKAYTSYLIAIFFAKECHCSHFFGLCYRYITVFVKRNVLTNCRIDNSFYLSYLLIGYFAMMRKVKSQLDVIDVRAFLFDVRSQHLTQSVVKKMCRSVVRFYRITLFFVHFHQKRLVKNTRQLLYDVESQLIFFQSVRYACLSSLILDITAVSDLSAHLCIERSSVKNQLIAGIVFVCYLSVSQKSAFGLKSVVSDKFSQAFKRHNLHPVVSKALCGIARTLFLFGKVSFKTRHINTVTFLLCHKFGQINRETVGIKQFKGKVSVYGFVLSCRYVFVKLQYTV